MQTRLQPLLGSMKTKPGLILLDEAAPQTIQGQAAQKERTHGFQPIPSTHFTAKSDKETLA